MSGSLQSSFERIEANREARLREAADRKGWPVLHEAALLGLAGDFVRVVPPQSEADHIALLAQFLTMFGIAAGPSAHFIVESTPHPARLFV
jgi:hypothetical protein